MLQCNLCSVSARSKRVSLVFPAAEFNNMWLTVLVLSLAALAAADVAHILETTTTEAPPHPYLFSYSAGRYPGHVDREHAEVSDGKGTVRGKFSYIDPAQKIRTVDYVADKQGFHPVLSEEPPEHPADSESVARAKDRHYQLYAKIAADHATHPHPDPAASVPRQSAAVAAAALRHTQLFRVIAEQHARIAAEREALQREEEEKRLLEQPLDNLQHLHEQ